MQAQWAQLTLSGEIPGQILWAPLDDILDPLIELTRPIAGTAWIPLGLVVFGIGDGLTTCIVFHAVFFPLVLNTVGGARSVDRHLLEAARTLGVGRSALVLQVVLARALPSVLYSYQVNLSGIIACMLVAGLVGFTLDAACRWLAVQAAPWA